MKNFRVLRVWQMGMEIARQAFNLAETVSREDRFGLFGQITKSAVSIPSNVAEGCSRASTKDYIRYLEIALGSGFELETQLAIASSVGLGDKHIREKMLRDLQEEQQMLGALIRKLKVDSKASKS